LLTGNGCQGDLNRENSESSTIRFVAVTPLQSFDPDLRYILLVNDTD